MWSPCVESGAESPGCSGALNRRKPPNSRRNGVVSGEGVGGGGLGGGVGGGLGGGVGGGLGRSFAGAPAEVDWAPGVGFLFLGGDVAICRITNYNTITLTFNFKVVFTETSGAVTDMSFMSTDPIPDIWTQTNLS